MLPGVSYCYSIPEKNGMSSLQPSTMINGYWIWCEVTSDLFCFKNVEDDGSMALRFRATEEHKSFIDNICGTKGAIDGLVTREEMLKDGGL